MCFIIPNSNGLDYFNEYGSTYKIIVHLRMVQYSSVYTLPLIIRKESWNALSKDVKYCHYFSS